MAKVLLLTLVANSAALRGDRECGVEGGEAGAAGRRLGSPRPPFAEPDEIDGDRGHDVLQVRLGEAEVTGMAQAAAADGLLVGGLDAGARRVARAELGRRPPVPGGVQSLVVLARLQADDPRLELGSGAAGAQRAGRAVLRGEAGLEDHAVLRVGVGHPRDAAFAGGAGDPPPLPVDQERRLGEPLALARLPARVVGDRTDDLDAEAA